ncbi:alkaline phosphatase [Fusibacter sp. 3D3]|uniref:alkaline phosphatase n=1 Tax=Fusibacter sp. 3D3 TaxID=1048380 RepID=UPI00085309DF|nr:alkaline phosphatase [Fusibacter sp. 3D3]GAU78982.1 alkaline phosphatase [Fusibacter sp. 3D3]
MKTLFKKMIASLLVLTLMIGGSFALSYVNPAAQAITTDNTWSGSAPKYVFLFIGDGMSYPQFTAASDYLGAVASEGKKVESKNLGFTEFPVTGSAMTFDSSSFCPDSASTATSISTGFKTLSGVINMDEQKSIAYETISEKLKKQKGYKVGVISSVPINHATPAAFYAHQASRNNYYDIALELVNSDFDYFGGGGFLQQTGKASDKKDILEIAKEKGYTVANTKESILGLTAASGKVIAINPELVGSALPYEIDRKAGELSLADFTRKGIDTLYNETGFFMMVEGGKIDWACHANDAMASIKDTIAFNDAVSEAVKFYEKYPDDTLIIVTGDHETGGLTIGFAGTKYGTYLDNLSNQDSSYEVFDKSIETYRTNKTPFETVLKDIKAQFGLMTQTDVDASKNAEMVLSDYEYKKLKSAYDMSMIAKADRKTGEEEYLLYGGYEPLSIAVTHLLNNKSGIGWTSYSHTGVPVAVFANGKGSHLFNGYYDNTDLFVKLKALTNVK